MILIPFSEEEQKTIETIVNIVYLGGTHFLSQEYRDFASFTYAFRSFS